jgi:uncharacterized protein YcbX
MQHLHWVSAGRIDVSQPAAVVAIFRLGGNVGTTFRIRKRPAHKFVPRAHFPKFVLHCRAAVQIGGTSGLNAGNLLENRMSANPSAEITGLYRYPVKGLTPEPLQSVTLRPAETLPADRRYAIENGPSPFDPKAPAWLPKPYFLMLQRDEWLAPLRTHFDDASYVLTIRRGSEIVAQGDLETPEGRTAIERFFATAFADRIKGPPKVLTSPGHSFSDVAPKVVSIINLSSLAAIENMVGFPVHPLRFRANVYVKGWPAWHEASLVGETLAIGTARARVVKRINRCAAVNVDPDLGVRDLEIPQALMRRLGHMECGIYAEVIEGGTVAVGDAVAAEQPTLV